MADKITITLDEAIAQIEAERDMYSSDDDEFVILSDAAHYLTALKRLKGELHIVFDGPPSHESGRFVEVETPDGKSVRAGRWEQRGDFWHLILPGRIKEAVPEEVEATLAMLDTLRSQAGILAVAAVESMADKAFHVLSSQAAENEDLRKTLRKREKEIEVRKANLNFCPDCRDKVSNEPCQRCEVQRQAAEIAKLRGEHILIGDMCVQCGYPNPALTAMRAEIAELKALHWELLYPVSMKYPDESRHETALRYIKEAEARHHEAGEAQAESEFE